MPFSSAKTTSDLSLNDINSELFGFDTVIWLVIGFINRENVPILIIFLLIKLMLVSARSTDNSLVVKLVSVMVVLEFVNVPLISDNFGSLYQEYVGNVSLLIEFRKFILVSNRFILEKLKLNFVVLFVYIVYWIR